jgi:hypothetical protein
MDSLQKCTSELRKLSSERDRDMRHLRLNHKLDQALEAGEEMDVINDAIFFLSEYQVMLNLLEL